MIKFILIAIILIFIYRLLARWKQQELNNVQLLSWLIFWLVAVIIVIYPQLTSYLANVLGVGRGADLVIYLSILSLFYLVFKLVTRIENLDKNLTRLVREIALKEDKNGPNQ